MVLIFKAGTWIKITNAVFVEIKFQLRVLWIKVTNRVDFSSFARMQLL